VKTHCPNGHSYDDAYMTKRQRTCRECALDRVHRYRERKRWEREQARAKPSAG
jgi:hypothetical protein